MKFINRTKNTVYLQDIDEYIPYLKDLVQEIDVDNILKSKGFQQFIALGEFEIVEYGDSRIENNLVRMQEKTKKVKSKLNKIQKLENDREDIVESKPDDIEVIVKGHFLEGGGYAKVNRNLAVGLNDIGVNTTISIVGNGKVEVTPDESKKLVKLRGNKVTKHAIRLDSVVPTFTNVSSGKNTILYTTVESYSVPDQFIEVAQMYDEVWVTSNFCAEVLKNHGLEKPIFVLPDSLDTSHYVEDGDKYEFRPSLKDFVFTSVFGWSYRKGYDVLLKAYLQEFSGNEDVSLLLVSKYQNSPKRSNYIKGVVDNFISEYGGKNPPHIARCSRSIPESQMPSLYRASDAFVLFTRGEGFSLTYCEASLCGLPIIGTNCSGQTMFLNQDNSYLIDIDKISEIEAGKMHVHYWDGQKFPELTSENTIEQAKKTMRQVYNNYEEAKNKNKKLQKFLVKNYSINKIANKAKKRLEKIWEKI